MQLPGLRMKAPTCQIIFNLSLELLARAQEDALEEYESALQRLSACILSGQSRDIHLGVSAFGVCPPKVCIVKCW